MALRSSLVPDDVYAYLIGSSPPEPPVLARLREVTAALPEAEMQIGPDQGQLMALLARLIGARNCIEIGTFTGYSALVVALALPEGGRLVACDVNETWTSIAKRFWKEAGVADRIELRLGRALDTLEALQREHGGKRVFDFAFVDADKGGYIGYFEKLLLMVRPGGLIAVDNTLAVSGTPIIRQEGAGAVALRKFNEHVRNDERVDVAMVPIGEGVTLLRVRG